MKMIYVYSVFYYCNKSYEINEHKFRDFETACEVVAEMQDMKNRNVYTIVDDSKDGER